MRPADQGAAQHGLAEGSRWDGGQQDAPTEIRKEGGPFGGGVKTEKIAAGFGRDRRQVRLQNATTRVSFGEGQPEYHPRPGAGGAGVVILNTNT